MDIVTDLSAEAVSYLTVIQDICKNNLSPKYRTNPKSAYIWAVFNDIDLTSVKCTVLIESRIGELVWSSRGSENIETKKNYFYASAKALLFWLKPLLQNHLERELNSLKINLTDDSISNFVEHAEISLSKIPDIWVSPDFWRKRIVKILYETPHERIRLVEAINYMPVQIVFALPVNKPGVYKQRLFQFYFDLAEVHLLAKNNNSGDVLKEDLIVSELLTDKDAKTNMTFWGNVEIELDMDEHQIMGMNYRDCAKELLQNDELLLRLLNYRGITVSFENLFKDELNEIAKSRLKRLTDLNENDVTFFPRPMPANSFNNNPQIQAENMDLAALAFSGGGIRSATFNLGILQKLAELGSLPRFDYLSTVSGGGYVGNWLTSWIMRDGSIKKVSDRLNKNVSTDPLAEEVRPIRWLRMFSNYLAPNASIMSADSWTMGITWLRNTVINQVVLLLLLLTVLSVINVFYRVWNHFINAEIHVNHFSVLVASCVLFPVGAFLAGSGMRSYDRAHPPQSAFNLGRSWILAYLLIGWGVISAYLLSLWFFVDTGSSDYKAKIIMLTPAAVPCFFAMLIVAFMGGYHHFGVQKIKKIPAFPIYLQLALIGSTIAASIAGVSLIASGWQLIQFLCNQTSDPIKAEFQNKLVLICGVPVFLEAICITVVVRMALMGDYFPDERREWWGRMGALVHRFILYWMLVTFSALLLPEYAKLVSSNLILSALPGWGAIIGFAVKMAYQSSSSNNQSGSSISTLKEAFIRIAPYLFMLGFLLIGAFMLKVINVRILPLLALSFQHYACLISTLILMILTGLLSWRVGVNEFSLHDFYRNRLVRAYMGGSRRRTDRENTANSFTGFDKEDDFPLALMRAKYNYAGPIPLINTTLNSTSVYELDRQDRMAESFLFSPLYCGFDFNPTRSASYTRNQVFEYGYRPTEHYSGETGPLAGTSMAISGAAVSPNMGYHSSPATAFLLTIFNVRLGRWIGNPRKNTWQRSDPKLGLGYLVKDLIGKSDIDSNYVYLSDGGHFDNMGLYELIRRRCKYIVLCDAEEDEKAVCEGLGNAIRRCRIDFGVEIELDVTPITKKIKDTHYSKAHLVKGKIIYPEAEIHGRIIYIKTSLTGDEDVDIREYFLSNSEFPQQSTGDQFFDESQFESYRKLGYHSIQNAADLI